MYKTISTLFSKVVQVGCAAGKVVFKMAIFSG